MSENNDDEQLAIAIIAKLSDLEKSMKRAEAITQRSYDTMQRNSTRATSRMETDMVRSTRRINEAAGQSSTTLGKFGKAMAASFNVAAIGVALAAVAIAAVIDQTKKALDAFGDISDKSAQSGVDAEFFQELTYQAGLAGVGVDELTASLSAFNKNSGLAVQGQGKMVAQLKKLNPELLENIRNAKSQEERVKLAADAIDKQTTAAGKAALATALFGDAGTKLVSALSGGSKAMEETAQKARELGIIVSNDLIARADDLGDEFETATKIMDTQFKQALIDLAPFLIEAAKLAGLLAQAITGIIDSMRDLENQTTRGLNQQLATIGAQRLDIENQILAKQQEQRDEVAKMSDTARNLGFDNTENPALPGPGAIDDLQKQNDELGKQAALITEIIYARNQAAAKVKTVENTATLPPLPADTKAKAAAKSDIDKQREAVEALIASLEVERGEVGMSALEIAKANALRQAGAVATQSQKDYIVALIDATYREKAARDAVNESLQNSAALGKDVFGGIIQGFRDGASAAEIFNGVLTKIADKLVSMSLDSLFDGAVAGSGGGLLGGLFKVVTGGFPAAPKGGLYAEGGYTGPGDRMQPAGIVHKGEFVVNAAATRRIGVGNLERLNGYANGGLVAGPSTLPPAVSASGGANRVDLNLHLTDDSGRVVGIVDERIQKHGPGIVKVSVDQATKVVKHNLGKWQYEHNQRYGR